MRMGVQLDIATYPEAMKSRTKETVTDRRETDGSGDDEGPYRYFHCTVTVTIIGAPSPFGHTGTCEYTRRSVTLVTRTVYGHILRSCLPVHSVARPSRRSLFAVHTQAEDDMSYEGSHSFGRRRCLIV